MKQLRKCLCGILALVMCISVMTGCAANPDKGVVTSKNDGVFEQNMTVPATAPLDEQIQYTETFTSTDGTAEYFINFDQNISSDPLPIVEVVPRFFTGEDVKRIAQVLFGDADFYEREHEEDAQYSKSQLQKRINWMTEIANTEAMNALLGAVDQDGYAQDYTQQIDLLKMFMQQYTVQMETAPEDNPHEPCDWTFKRDSEYASSYNAYGNDWIIATVDLGEVNYHIYTIRRDKGDYKHNNLSVQFGDGLGYPDLEMAYLRAKLCRTPEPTQEQVKALAEKAQTMLDQMGMGEWKVCYTNIIEETYGDAVEYQVQIGASPVINNVQSIYGQRIKDLTSEDANASNYFISSAIFHFSANGDLIYFDMTAPVEVKTVVNESASILSTEDLMDLAREHLSLFGAEAQYMAPILSNWYQKPFTCKVEIDRIEFGLARIRVPNKDFTFYYVPAFVLHGHATYYDKQTGAYIKFPYEPNLEMERPLVWINAVDGSIISES